VTYNSCSLTTTAFVAEITSLRSNTELKFVNRSA